MPTQHHQTKLGELCGFSEPGPYVAPSPCHSTPWETLELPLNPMETLKGAGSRARVQSRNNSCREGGLAKTGTLGVPLKKQHSAVAVLGTRSKSWHLPASQGLSRMHIWLTAKSDTPWVGWLAAVEVRPVDQVVMFIEDCVIQDLVRGCLEISLHRPIKGLMHLLLANPHLITTCHARDCDGTCMCLYWKNRC